MNTTTILTKIKDYIFNYAKGTKSVKIITKEYVIQTIDTNKLQLLLNTTYCQKILGEIQHDLEKSYLALKERENEHKLNTSKHNDIVNKMHLITADLNIIVEKRKTLQKEADSIQREIKNQFNLKSHTYT